MIEITESEWKTIRTVARNSKRRYPMVEEEDVVQELGLWMLEHEDHIRKWREEEHGYKARYRSLKRAARAYCERDKAWWGGYELEDVTYYSINQLKKLVPLAFEGYTGLMAKADEKVRSGGDPAVSGDLQAMVVDVKSALRVIDQQAVGTLLWATQHNFDYGLMAESKPDYRRDRVGAHVRRALTAIQNELGGPNPHREYTGKRKVMSNAQARSVLRHQEEGQ